MLQILDETVEVYRAGLLVPVAVGAGGGEAGVYEHEMVVFWVKKLTVCKDWCLRVMYFVLRVPKAPNQWGKVGS